MRILRKLFFVVALACIVVPLSSAHVLDGAPPGDVTLEAVGPDGTNYSWDDPTGTCSPPSGSLFPIGDTTVTGCTDADGNPIPDFTVTVQDTTPPSFGSLPNVTATANDSGGTNVSYSTPMATDAVSGSIAGSCAPASGSHFDVGTTSVSCTATDSAGNTGQGGFDVIVSFDQPPSLSLPGDQTVHTTDSSGAQVTYSATASDNEDGALTPTCAPGSGSVFPVGTSTVSCSVTDSGGNTASGSFDVTVILDTPPPPADTTPPTFSGVPANIHVEANGPSGSVANFSAPTATDDVDGPIAQVVCAPASGSTFPLGTTTVTCSATDSHGNTGTASFTVAVVDTTPPHFIPPGDRSVYATSPSGIYPGDDDASSFLLGFSVSDIADPHPTVTHNAPSFFPVGVTVVTFVAHDASGNTASGQARLDVRPMPPPGTTPPALPPPADRTPPDDVTNLVATAGDATIVLKWTKPTAKDFNHVIITRARTTPGALADTVYTGSANSVADHGVQNGIEYRYVVVAVDKAGNRSGGVVAVAVPKASALMSPKSGAKIKKSAKSAKFRWRTVKGARYYNLQLFRGGERVLAAGTAVKVLSTWPTRTSFVLKRQWKYAGKRYKLSPGVYTWYVWPGLGPRSAAEYGPLLGASSFQVG
jgi:hypothetical protein